MSYAELSAAPPWAQAAACVIAGLFGILALAVAALMVVRDWKSHGNTEEKKTETERRNG